MSAATGRQTRSLRSTMVTSPVDQDHEGGEHEHAGEHAGHVEHAFGLLDDVAETGGRAEILAHHRAHHREPDRSMERGEHPRQRRRPVDVAHELALAHAEHAGVGEDRRAHLLDALIDVEEHDEEHQRDAERHLRGDAEAEPEREDRREHHARQRIDHLHIGIEHRGDRAAAARTRSRPARPPTEPMTKASTASTSVTQRCFQIVPS